MRTGDRDECFYLQNILLSHTEAHTYVHTYLYIEHINNPKGTTRGGEPWPLECCWTRRPHSAPAGWGSVGTCLAGTIEDTKEFPEIKDTSLYA